MAISDEKLIALIGKPAADAVLNSGLSVVSDQEILGWKSVLKKYEFLLSAVYMVARKPLRDSPEVDADELRHLIESSLKMVGIVNDSTPFDDLRHQLGQEAAWRESVTKILNKILDSHHVDSDDVSAIGSLISK